MSALPKPLYSPKEYLELDRAAEFKSEYVAGEIFAMAGASEEHIIITDNLTIALGTRLRGGSCRPFSSDMRVSLGLSEMYVYPDIVVVCGERPYADDRRDVLVNPTLIVEVLSSTTEAFDRGDKSAAYRQLASLKEYVLIAQDRPHVELYSRQPAGRWLLSEVDGLEAAIQLQSVGCNLPLAEIYDGVSFAARAAAKPDQGEAARPPR
jgi:Uma2 family endonuclease